MTRVCSKCRKEKPEEVFKGKSGRKTRMCQECRARHSGYQLNSSSRFRERKTESFSLSYCPWESGDVRPVPFGGVM